MDYRKNKFAALLLVGFILFSLLSGCSRSKAGNQVDAKLEVAIKYLAEQKYKEAILAYQEVIKIDSKNVTAYKGISLAYILQEKPAKAEQALQEGLKAVPQNVSLQLAMAGLLADQGKGEQAEAIYWQLICSDNPTLVSYRAYTDYLSQQGKTAEAISLLEQASASQNRQAYQLNSLLAEQYYQSGDKDKALAALNKSLNAQLDQAAAYDLLTKMYQGQWAELAALGDQYIQQDQARAGQLIKLTALYNLGSYQDLIDQYENLPAEVQDSAPAMLLAARAYLKLGRSDQAGAVIKQVKVADLKDAGLLAGLAGYYLAAGDKENARKLALQGIELDESAVASYAVMYQSYAGADEAQAKIWAYKCLLKSGLGYRSGLNALAEAGISLKTGSAAADVNLKTESTAADVNLKTGSTEVDVSKPKINQPLPSTPKEIQKHNALTETGVSLKTGSTAPEVSEISINQLLPYTPKAIQENKNDYAANENLGGPIRSLCYLNTKENVVYVVRLFTPADLEGKVSVYGWHLTSEEQLFKNFVFRIHNPKLIPVSQIPNPRSKGEGEIINLVKETAVNNYLSNVVETTAGYSNGGHQEYYAVYPGTDSYEKAIEAAGIPRDSIIFVDI